MKVRELIKKLKKMPQNINVYTSNHDNYEWETSGNVSGVYHCVKEDLRKDAENHLKSKNDIERFESNDDE